MPTIFRSDNTRVWIYPNDHRPAHVHIGIHDNEAVFLLNCPDGPPELRENKGFSRREITKIAKLLPTLLKIACAEWERIHGQY